MKFRNRRSRLHRVTYQAVVHELDAGDASGLAEGGVGGSLVAEVPVAAQIVGHIVVHERSIRLERIREADESALRSAPVNTASTPGMARAAPVSMDLIFACACGERTKTPATISGRSISAT